MMRVQIAVAACFLIAAQAATANRVVTQTSLGGVGLGMTSVDYARVLGEEPFVTGYADRTSRLLFVQAEIAVTLDAKGHGVAVSTAAPEYMLRGKVGPCGRLGDLARAYRLIPQRVPGPLGPRGVVYRSGQLWFTLSTPSTIGRITLASSPPSLNVLISDAQCGTGEKPGD